MAGEEGERGKAVIVGGSIAGISCAHALTLAGWNVLVLEKTPLRPTGSPTHWFWSWTQLFLQTNHSIMASTLTTTTPTQHHSASNHCSGLSSLLLVLCQIFNLYFINFDIKLKFFYISNFEIFWFSNFKNE